MNELARNRMVAGFIFIPMGAAQRLALSGVKFLLPGDVTLDLFVPVVADG